MLRNNERFTNAKLSRIVVEKLISDKNISAIQIDLLLLLCSIQDECGDFSNVHFTDVTIALSCCKATFYNALLALEKANYIKINWNDRMCWSGTVVSNVFSDSEDDKKGYLRTNISALYSRKFKNLKANEKKILLFLFTNYKTETGMDAYIKTIGSWIGIDNISLIRKYLENIKEFFPFSYKESLQGTLVSFKSNITFVANSDNEASAYLYKLFKRFLNIHRIPYTLCDLKDLVSLAIQFKLLGTRNVIQHIFDILKRKSKITIQPRLIYTFLDKIRLDLGLMFKKDMALEE